MAILKVKFNRGDAEAQRNCFASLALTTLILIMVRERDRCKPNKG